MNLPRFLLLAFCVVLVALAVVHGTPAASAPAASASLPIEGSALLARAWDRVHAMPGR